MMEVYVVGARAYSFTDEKTNRLVEGVNVWHLTKTEDGAGQIPAKISLPYETWGYIKTLNFPDLYTAVTNQQFTPKGIVTKVTGIQPLKK